jgi:ribosomal protein L12E/L44/L45/RPP1/RPP2
MPLTIFIVKKGAAAIEMVVESTDTIRAVRERAGLSDHRLRCGVTNLTPDKTLEQLGVADGARLLATPNSGDPESQARRRLERQATTRSTLYPQLVRTVRAEGGETRRALEPIARDALAGAQDAKEAKETIAEVARDAMEARKEANEKLDDMSKQLTQGFGRLEAAAPPMPNELALLTDVISTFNVGKMNEVLDDHGIRRIGFKSLQKARLLVDKVDHVELRKLIVDHVTEPVAKPSSARAAGASAASGSAGPSAKVKAKAKPKPSDGADAPRAKRWRGGAAQVIEGPPPPGQPVLQGTLATVVGGDGQGLKPEEPVQAERPEPAQDVEEALEVEESVPDPSGEDDAAGEGQVAASAGP